MSTEIYWFTGTGNSLAVGRGLAEKLGGKLTAIASVVDRESVVLDAEVVGIVFPVYHQGVPHIIQRFIAKLQNVEGKYIFAVCTYGDSPGISIDYLRQFLEARAGSLAAGFAVQAPYNYLAPSARLIDFFAFFQLRKVSQTKQRRLFARMTERLADISSYVNNREQGKFERKGAALEHFLDFLNLRETLKKSAWMKVAGVEEKSKLPFAKSIALMDCAFQVSEGCTECGICARVCPVTNIDISRGYPVWNHQCEQCMACLQWCPNGAIKFRNATVQGRRYRHPEIKLQDIIDIRRS